MAEEKPEVSPINVENLKKQAEPKYGHKHDAAKESQKMAEDRYLRLRADFENFKKRSAAERDEIISFSNEVLIVSLLPVLDNFERAIEAVDSLQVDKKTEEFLKGVALVYRHMLDTFNKLGLEEIKAEGQPFDPAFHEAAMHRKDEKHPSGIVLEVLQKGYLFKGKVVRHSVVVVSKNE